MDYEGPFELWRVDSNDSDVEVQCLAKSATIRPLVQLARRQDGNYYVCNTHGNVLEFRSCQGSLHGVHVLSQE